MTEVPTDSRREQQDVLVRGWRQLRRLATIVAVLTSPAIFAALYHRLGWTLSSSIVVTILTVLAFRGLLDILARRYLPWPSLYQATDAERREDVLARRRTWYWRQKWRMAAFFVGVLGGVFFGVWALLQLIGHGQTPGHMLHLIFTVVPNLVVEVLPLLVLLPMYMVFNFFILFAPMMAFGLRQIKGYEPGDADWGVRLEDVRGQAEAKEEVNKVISLWQSGDEFERSGGKRERGLLFLGAPGTGKTMLAKAIATGFNCPFVTVPGSGFAQTFIGMDVAIVLYLIHKAKKLARKWGGQCIIFIDEIDAVGMRRQALGAGMPSAQPESPQLSRARRSLAGDDLVLQNDRWQELVFQARAEQNRQPLTSYQVWVQRINQVVIPGMGMMGGGGMALNQLLVQMDGVDDPPFVKKFVSNRINTFLDATYIIPQRLGPMPLRMPTPKPAPEQIFFIGATNVPLGALDPALIRPGRMGRHIAFRTPNQSDRKDIFDLYITKVTHVEDLDSDKRREELARITAGYSPAMIDQVCSMALTYAHADGRLAFDWDDIVNAMTTVESGAVTSFQYRPEEAFAIAIHEAGHAVTSYLYEQNVMAVRLSIKPRGSSGGHYSRREEQESFTSWRHELLAEIICSVGSMAAEYAFYGESSSGVGGDLWQATSAASDMVGRWGMGPIQLINLTTAKPKLLDRLANATGISGPENPLPLGPDRHSNDPMDRCEIIGAQLIQRSGTGPMSGQDPMGGVMTDPSKRRAVAQLLGQAYVTAYNAIRLNSAGLEQLARTIFEAKEIHGDALVDLLNSCNLITPDIDWTDDAIWPTLSADDQLELSEPTLKQLNPADS
jgi:ATP-dependent Zn protease